MAQGLISEIFSDNYKVLASNIEFFPGDIVIDIGACEGMFSIMLAKLFPSISILALEPISHTFFHMVRNIGLNGIANIAAHNIGLAGKTTNKFPILMCKHDLSGGGSAVMTFNPDQHEKVEVTMMSLDDLWTRFKLNRVKLVKIDVEGMEYDILYNTSKLDNIDYFTGEFHMNSRLDYQGYRMDALASWVSNRTKVICIEACRMAE